MTNSLDVLRMNKGALRAGESVSVSVPGVGAPVVLRVSKRARRLSIIVKQDQSVRVTIPRGVTIDQAGRFVEAKRQWICRSLAKLRTLRRVESGGELPEVSREQARAMLVGRLERLARIHGFEYNRVSVRSQRTRWGSCSSKDNISLNVNLVRLPDELRDYVLLHELVHTRVKNHGKRFWRELDKVVGDARAMQKRLRGYRIC